MIRKEETSWLKMDLNLLIILARIKEKMCHHSKDTRMRGTDNKTEKPASGSQESATC